MHLQHRRVDLQQQGAPQDKSVAGAMGSMSAVGSSDRWGCVEITHVKREEDGEDDWEDICRIPEERSSPPLTSLSD